jgi:hypothetical protein
MRSFATTTKVILTLSLFSSIGFSKESVDVTELLTMKKDIKCIKSVDFSSHDTSMDNDEGFVEGASDSAKTNISFQKNDGTTSSVTLRTYGRSESNIVEIGGGYIAAAAVPYLLFFIGKGATIGTSAIEYPFVEDTYAQIFENQGDTLTKVTIGSELAAAGYYAVGMILTADNRVYSIVKANSSEREVLANL